MERRIPISVLLWLSVIVVNNFVTLTDASVFSDMISNLKHKLHSTIEKRFGNVIVNVNSKGNGNPNINKLSDSILSNFFGPNKSRKDLTLPLIYTTVFSRNSGISVNTKNSGSTSIILVAGSNTNDANRDTTVSISTNHNGNRKHLQVTTENVDSSDDIQIEATYQPEDDEYETVLLSTSIEPSKEEREDKDDERNNTYYRDIMSNWKKFIASELWYSQDNKSVVSSRIINGLFLNNDLISGASFTTKFFYRNDQNESVFYCSGNLIHPQFILTAAHCNIQMNDEAIIGGRYLQEGIRTKVKQVTNHPNYNKDILSNDISIITIESVKGHESEQEQVELNKNKTILNITGVLSSYGTVDQQGLHISNDLQSTRHQVHPFINCQRHFEDIEYHPSYICIGDNNRSTSCIGDSGAGLWMWKSDSSTEEATGRSGYYVLLAIVSFGQVTDNELCPLGPPSIFQNVAFHYDWIQSIVVQ